MENNAQYEILPLSAELQSRVKNFVNPSTLGFGTVVAPVMARSEYQQGQWSKAELVPFENLSVSPACRAFHYGQLIFEGMKAYRYQGGEAALFRPYSNFTRFNQSAERMAMPILSEETFMQAVKSLVCHMAEHIPQGEGESLYLRPLMIASDQGLSLRSSSTFLFLVMASPSGAYFQESEVSALIEREDCRAAPGGTGAYKVAGNYGASIRSSRNAQKLHYNQTLWLDAVHKRYIEEFSGMNFFAIINGELYTPALNSSILPGVTRDSLLKLASEHSIKSHETLIAIDELIREIESGSCTEIFACGTAAVVAPVASLGEKDGTLYRLAPTKQSLAMKLRDSLVKIQCGKREAPAGWVYRVPPLVEANVNAHIVIK